MPSPKTYPATRVAVWIAAKTDSTKKFTTAPKSSSKPSFTRVCAPTSTASSAEETLYLVTGDGERVQISPEMYGPLTSVARAFADRKDVCVVRQDRLMTTQEAADYLGVSRPTVVRLLERGDIPFERINTHRRVAFDDLERYRLEHEYVNRRVR